MSISFDRIADTYDATRGFPHGIDGQVAAALVHEAGLTAGARLLEIGVGTGRIALPVAAYLHGLRYVGVDISRKMMATLRSKDSSGSIQLLQADAGLLPFANGTFDATLVVHVLHLVSDPEAVLAALWHVMRPGGLFLHGYNDTEIDGPLAELRGNRWDTYVEEAGGTIRSRARRAAIDDQIEHIFGQPRLVTLATWDEEMSPRGILNGLNSRSPSATWDIPEPIFRQAMEQTEAWAKEQFDDLDRPHPIKASFKLKVYER